jgi:hypothetical protein
VKTIATTETPKVIYSIHRFSAENSVKGKGLKTLEKVKRSLSDRKNIIPFGLKAISEAKTCRERRILRRGMRSRSSLYYASARDAYIDFSFLGGGVV